MSDTAKDAVLGRITFGHTTMLGPAATPSDRDALRANLAELYRLYKWRFVLAEREQAGEDVRHDLNVYGQQKKAAWELAAKLLGDKQSQPPDAAGSGG